jgi:DNA-binding transcriptional ArsR family regulator
MVSIVSDKDKQRDQWLPALAHPARRRVVEMLSERARTAGELHGAFPIAAPAMSRHLRVLRSAGLIGNEPKEDDARVRIYSLRVEPIEDLTTWLSGLSSHWKSQLESFKRYAEQRDSEVD